MNPFKKYCIVFAVISACCLLIVHPILFYINLLGSDFLAHIDEPALIMNDHLKVKEAHAKSSSGRKIFVLSCSTAAYAVDTAMMERELGFTVVNFGTTIALRTYMFDRIKRSLNSGDIVLMPLEYHVYKDQPVDTDIVNYVLEYDPGYFGELSAEYKLKFMYAVKTHFLLRRIAYRIAGNKSDQEVKSFLSSRNLNANGDLRSNTYETRTYRKPHVPARQNFSADDAPGKETANILRNFIEYCRKSHIDLYVTWPPLCPITGKREFFGHDAEVADGIKTFWASNDVVMLGDYHDAFFEVEDCYNSQNHLNDRGRVKYTRHLLELIRPYI